jgi:hypothetical protein
VLLTGTLQETADKPTLFLESVSEEGVEWLRGLFFGLARSPWPTGVRLDGQERASFGEGMPTISLWHRGRPYHPKMVIGPDGDLIWTCTAEEWQVIGESVGVLLQGPGHRYLTSEADDQVVVEASFHDPWVARTGPSFKLGHPGQQHYLKYASGKYPDPRDMEIDTFILGLRGGGPRTVERAIALASQDNAATLESYAARTAVRVVRGGPADLLVSGLVALAIAVHHDDPRDVLRLTSLLDDAARRREVDLHRLFASAGAAVGPMWSEYLVVWPNRDPENRTPECMGYLAVERSDGFAYGLKWS